VGGCVEKGRNIFHGTLTSSSPPPSGGPTVYPTDIESCIKPYRMHRDKSKEKYVHSPLFPFRTL